MQRFLTIVVIFFVFTVNGQVTEQPSSSRWSAYLELGGAGIQFYTVNTEYFLTKLGRFNVNARVGVGYGNFEGRVGYTSVRSNQELNFLAVVLGLTAFNFVAANHHFETGFVFEYVKGTQIDGLELQNSSLLFTPSFGYRFQKPSGGLILKLLYTPNIPIQEFNRMKFNFPGGTSHNIGISAGYAFKRKQ